MNKWIIGILCLGVASSSNGQGVQWASSVIEFSSQKTPKANSAGKILGSPNAMPQGGLSLDAWEPGEGKRETIRVRFANPTSIEQVVILENYMPGALVSVIATDTEGKEHELAKYTGTVPPVLNRVLEIAVQKTPYKVEAIRLEVNPFATADIPQYDAVGIMEKASPLVLIQPVPNLTLTAQAERLPDAINSAYPEDAPLVSFDEKSLYFSRGLHPGNVGGAADIEDVWVSKANPDGTWADPVNLGPPINNRDANFIFSETKQGGNILLGNIYASEGTMKAGASIAKRLPNGTYSAPKALIIKNDQNINDQVDYVLNTRGDILIIAEERNNSLGNRDLHVSFLQADSTWSEPVNLGPAVNTASDEFAPFLAPDDRSLFFSTAGRPGYGDVDIFVCSRIGEGWSEWTEPQNLGSAINGPSRDSYFSLPARGEFAYFTTVGKGTSETDIYKIKFPRNLDSRPNFTTPLVDGTLAQPDNAAIAPQDKPSQIVSNLAPEAQSIPASAAAPSQAAVASQEPSTNPNDGMVAAPATEATPAPVAKPTSIKSPRRKPAPLDQPSARTEMQFESIQFDFSKADISEANNAELAKVAEYLKENPKAVIRIAGHTDGVGPAAYNVHLSRLRANAVAAYLMQQGVAARSLKRKGYGEAKPKATNDTDEGRTENRRVEFVILKL
jgi:OmpA-OmpF porin, OOP family